jgi:RimJ/RimL family protein N-acetyltransferase
MAAGFDRQDMRITVDDARAYFAHPSQQRASMIDADDLPAEGVEYWAKDGVCGLFHPANWQGVWMAHYGVKPEAWGHAIAPAKAILTAFWNEKQPARVIGWTKESNRAALAFARRLGFTVDGRMDLPEPVIMQGWRL